MKILLLGATLVTSAIAGTSVVAHQGNTSLEASYSETSPASSSECTTIKPGPGWICVGGGWYPPGMTPPGGEPPATPAPAGEESWYPSTPPATGSSTGGRLRAMTWNIDLTRDPAGQAQEIADSGADVVLLQEVTRWSEDTPRTFPERLRQLTGQTWFSVWAPHFGRYSEDEGTLILTRLPVVDRSTRRVYDRGFGRILVDVGGVHVNVLNAHLDWYDTSMRSAQLEDFMWWGRQFSGPRVAGGDFNAWWGEWWINRMTAEHSDTWVDVTGSTENGYTLNGAVRFDYLFRAFTDNWRVTPTAVWVPWTSRSDHYPVLADYTVR